MATIPRSVSLDAAIEGSPRGRFLVELFSNSALFPIANILLELLLDGPGYLLDYRFYALAFGATAQAWFLSSRVHGPGARFAGNLAAPAIYTLSEVADHGLAFFAAPHHVAYWLFALTIGTLQAARGAAGRFEGLLHVIEGLVRSLILLVMYAIFEGMTEPAGVPSKPFFADPSHVFMAWAVVLLGLLGGVAAVTSERYLALLRMLSRRFRVYSQWLLGPTLLEEAVRDPHSLALRRLDRAVLFADVRGFTAWSESQSPEAVLRTLEACYVAAEGVFEVHRPVHFKYVADEVMAVFVEPADAWAAARELADAFDRILRPHGLGVGIGLHWGPVVEGIIGGAGVKHFDAIGDTVNTAKRIEGSAAAGEVLLSGAFCEAAGLVPPGPARSLQVKGKSAALSVHGVRPAG